MTRQGHHVETCIQCWPPPVRISVVSLNPSIELLKVRNGTGACAFPQLLTDTCRGNLIQTRQCIPVSYLSLNSTLFLIKLLVEFTVNP
jgi:hypothetical protein